eukprot:6422518-Amphidinium_carterae.1
MMHFVPFSDKEGLTKSCAKTFDIPVLQDWCPATLMDCNLLANYYNQRVLETLWKEGEENESVDFPHAIYLDAIDHGGTI